MLRTCDPQWLIDDAVCNDCARFDPDCTGCKLDAKISKAIKEEFMTQEQVDTLWNDLNNESKHIGADGKCYVNTDYGIPKEVDCTGIDLIKKIESDRNFKF